MIMTINFCTSENSDLNHTQNKKIGGKSQESSDSCSSADSTTRSFSNSDFHESTSTSDKNGHDHENLKSPKSSISGERPKRLQIGQLSRNVTEKHINEIFAYFGSVNFTELMIDRITQLNNGHAIVD